MSALSIPAPFPIFSDTTGAPLDSGYIYIGAANQDPVTNPIAAYWDAALTISAVQPIRTSGGYPVYNGSPANIYVNTDYSIRVNNSSGVLMYSSAAATGRFSGSVVAGVDSANVSYLPAGAGAIATTVQTKLRSIVAQSEYSTIGYFNVAKVGKLSIDSLNNFDAPVTPTGEPTQLQLASAVQTVAAGPRDAVVYYDATRVNVFRKHATMGGFRFRGQYTKGRAPTYPMPASNIVSTSSDLGAEGAVRTENWYAIFACANSGDATATLKLMPFLRAGTVSGNNVPLIKAGENVHSLTAQTYAWSATNNLATTECLVITENGRFSGRTTTITANSVGQITLETIGGVAAYDFILPAPPGYTNYVYLGSFYFDTGEIRNIADAGTVVKAKLTNSTDPNFTTSGAITTAVEIHFGGYICPLATAVVIKDAHTLSTASAGDHGGYFWHDGGAHEIHSNYEKKFSATSDTYVWDGIELPFSQWQSIYYSTAGTLAAARSGATIEIKGWIEP